MTKLVEVNGKRLEQVDVKASRAAQAQEIADRVAAKLDEKGAHAIAWWHLAIIGLSACASVGALVLASVAAAGH